MLENRFSLVLRIICYLAFHLNVQRRACLLEKVLTQSQNLLNLRDFKVNVKLGCINKYIHVRPMFIGSLTIIQWLSVCSES